MSLKETHFFVFCLILSLIYFVLDFHKVSANYSLLEMGDLKIREDFLSG